MKTPSQRAVWLPLMALIIFVSGCKGTGPNDSNTKFQEAESVSTPLDPSKFVQFETGQQVASRVVIYITDFPNAVFSLANWDQWKSLAACHSGNGKFQLAEDKIDPGTLNPVEFLGCDRGADALKPAAFSLVDSPLGDSALAKLSDSSGGVLAVVGVSGALAGLIDDCESKYGLFTIKDTFLKSFSCIKGGSASSGNGGDIYSYALTPNTGAPLAAVVELNGTKIGWPIDSSNSGIVDSLQKCTSRRGRFELVEEKGSAYSIGAVTWNKVVGFDCMN